MPNSTDTLDQTRTARKSLRRRPRKTVRAVKAAVRRLHKRRTRASRIAVGAITAALVLTSNFFAQIIEAADSSNLSSTNLLGRQRAVPLSQPIFEGAIAGTVVDPEGEVLTGAVVILLNIESMQIWMTSAASDGNFAFEDLKIGEYCLKVMAPGFEEEIETDLSVGPGETVRRSFRMTSLVAEEEKEAADPRVNPLVAAVLQGDIELVRAIIALGSEIDELDSRYDGTALGMAISSGRLDIVKLLLSYGADPNAREKDNRTATMRLDGDGSREIVQELVNAGAKLDLKDELGMTVLMRAARSDGEEVLQALIDSGAEVNATDIHGETALTNAVEIASIENVRVLLQAGADVNAQTGDGRTAIMVAIDDDHTEIVDLLIAYGAIR
jgi:hypothetical protein